LVPEAQSDREKAPGARLVLLDSDLLIGGLDRDADAQHERGGMRPPGPHKEPGDGGGR